MFSRTGCLHVLTWCHVVEKRTHRARLSFPAWLMGDTFAELPEFFETELAESIRSRTETLSSFRELGPPDLCHVLKSNGRKDVGTYHLVSGVDASSSATLATYITSLSYEIEQGSAWLGSKASFRIKGGVFCCYNAFSRLDVRVEVCIPGSVQTYTVNARGERGNATPEIWQETYLSAALRAILYADHPTYALLGYRKLDLFPTPDHEMRFVMAAENLFFKGWQLGSDPEIQVATIVYNHLSAGILRYFGGLSRYEHAVNLFEKLWSREPEVAALVARSYLYINEEIKAVQIMHQALQLNPHNFAVLHVQIDFLCAKGQVQWAVELAKQAVRCAPSEYVTWAKLAECHIKAGNWAEALLTLNSCPMFTYAEPDLHRIPPASRTHLPISRLALQSKLLEEDPTSTADADPALLRLPAPALRGTFASAYAILTKLVHALGWDDLLKYRSQVFVMEEEYRNPQPKEQADQPGKSNERGDHWLTFTDKRLCERWLDNLFMVLYEDLRIYTIWRAEQGHYDAQSLPYERTGNDWEILGELALRLHHPTEAYDAFVHCIQAKFSAKAYMYLLEHFTETLDVEKALSAAMHLAAYQHRWYGDHVYPSKVGQCIFHLIRAEGLGKVSNTLISMKPRPATLHIMQRYFAYAQEFRLVGSDA